MHRKVTLTDKQKNFIKENYKKMRTEEIAKALSLKSTNKVYGFLQEMNIIRKKHELTDEQKDFVRKNYLSMPETEIIKRLGLHSRFCLQRFKSSEGLIKYTANKEKKKQHRVVTMEIFFNVDARENWVA